MNVEMGEGTSALGRDALTPPEVSVLM